MRAGGVVAADRELWGTENQSIEGARSTEEGSPQMGQG